MSTNPTRDRRLGKYTILCELGRGGMGVVYLAEDRQLHRKVALKILNPALAHEAEFVESFRREAQTLASAYHPNIVHVHSFDTIDDHTLIDMEYIDGGTLTRHIADAPLAIEPAIRMATEVLGALDWCHTEGLVHRDIKPSNILFDRGGRARVADFGLAGAYARVVEKAMQESVSTGILWGTPRYAPPEAWDGAPPSPTWDVFATGVVLYESLTGQPPFDTTSPLTALKAMASGPRKSVAELAPDTPRWFCDAIHAMLAHEPDDRPPTAGDALRRFESTGSHPVRPIAAPCADDESTRIAQPKPRIEKRYTFGRRLLAALAVVGITIILAWTLARPNDASYAQVPVLQAHAFTGSAPSVDELMTLVRNAETDSWSIYDAHHYDDPPSASRSWRIVWDGRGAGEAIVQTETGLWVLDLEPGEDAASIVGHWAAYVSPDGSRLDAGKVNGDVRAIEGRGSMLANMHFISDMDGAQWERSVLLTGGAATDTAFLASIEEHPLLQPLIYNDLEPTAFPWISRVDRALPALIGSRCTATRVQQTFTADGILDESIWDRTANARTDNIVRGRPWADGSDLIVGFNDTALLVGVRAPANSGVPRFRLALLPQWFIPAAASPRYDSVVTPAGVTEQIVHMNGATQPWKADLSATLVMADRNITVEVAVPFAALGLEGPPSPDDRWRLNAVLEDAIGADTKPLAVWGWPEWERAEHGVVVAFDGS